MKPFKIEYIWLDGLEPTQQIRSKTKVIYLSDRQESVGIQDIPPLAFDGSNTNQSTTESSDCLLFPVYITPDPQRVDGLIALCEVFGADCSPSQSNYRRELHKALEANSKSQPLVGLEQEYFILKEYLPPNFSLKEIQSPQQYHYCGVGSKHVAARDFVEDHLNLCLSANLPVNGINAEVAPGQWKFNIGGPGINPLTTADSLIVARFLLQRLGEKYGYQINFDSTPFGLNWYGSHMSTSLSTILMREDGGMKWIYFACQALLEDKKISESLIPYGNMLLPTIYEKTDANRVVDPNDFISRNSNLITIPLSVRIANKGYFEDKRPGSNANPYRVLSFLINTVCENEVRIFSETREDK